MKQNEQTKDTAIAVLTFFFIITAQLFWNTIHGDGSVYAWVTRGIAEAGWFSKSLPPWTQTQVFAEHPYLFFYFGSVFLKIFGVSDIAVKLPNFTVAAISLFTIFKVGLWRNADKPKAYQIGLIAAYVLILNAVYIMQESQPSLDPMAHLLALLAVVTFLYGKKSFWSGFILSLAFLTKGLEMLPHLAALFIVICFVHRESYKDLFKVLALQLLGFLLPLLIWFATDHILWNGEWLSTYWFRQFTSRFFNKDNMHTVFSFSYISTYFQVYLFETLVLAAGLIKAKTWVRKNDSYFIYFVAYLFFNILAFLLIKKDSSQHLTGVMLVGSVLVGEYLWQFKESMKWRWLGSVPAFLLGVAFLYWGWYMANQDKNPDIWTIIKNEADYFSRPENQEPVVLKDSTPEAYGMVNTAQWYYRPHKVYSTDEADRELVGQNVIIFEIKNGKAIETKTVYTK
ncbi:MAG: ArnT family glycosyltransferase [Pseudobdellovibrio sp.]